MLQIQRVVHPTDLSEGARVASMHAVHLARMHRATLDVISVAPLLGGLATSPRTGVPSSPEGYEAQYLAEQESALRAYVQEFDTEGVALNVPAPYYDGTPAATILAHAQKVDADLIVMGTHGRHGLKRLLLGSVAETVVRSATCPVLLARPPTPGGRRALEPGSVLAAVDLESFTGPLVRHAAAVARLYNAPLGLLHVIGTPAEPDLVGLLLETPEQDLAPLQAAAMQRLQALRLQVTGPALPVTCYVASGPLLDEVTAALERIGPDLVVTASHGNRGRDRWGLGSVTEQIVRHTPCSLFIVKPAGKSLLPAEPDRASAAIPGRNVHADA